MCQEKLAGQKLAFPCNRKNFDPKVAYRKFLENVNTLKDMSALPKPVALPEDTTPEELELEKGSWHEACHRAFQTENVEQEKKKSEEIVPQEAHHSKRLKGATNHELCVFCEETILSAFTPIA